MAHNDPLQLLPQEKWTELQETFKIDWPKNISGYYVLETQKEFVTKGRYYGFKVYCPFGDISNGMVAFNVKSKITEIIILTPNSNTSKLEEALLKTQFINWTQPFMVPFAPHNVKKCLEKVLAGQNPNLIFLPSEMFILEKHSPPFTGTSLPPNITFGNLTSEHVDIIDSSWPHQHPSSDWYFRMLIEAGSGYGLFLNKELIAWTLRNEVGVLTNMYTVEGHRKKGYAALILKIISNKLLAEGKDVLMYCVEGNVAACSLYRKLGFKNGEEVNWCFFNDVVPSSASSSHR